MKYLWIVAVILLSGCTVMEPHKLEYRIMPNVAIKKVDSLSCREKSLKVRRVFSSSSFLSQNMKYVENGNKEFSFTESKWARSPSGAISAALMNSINKQNIFAHVSSFKSRSRSDLILETNVEDFMQYFTKDNNSSYVRVAFSMSLIDTRKNKVLKSKQFEKELMVDTIDAKGGVKALNKALSEVLEENNKWLMDSCK